MLRERAREGNPQICTQTHKHPCPCCAEVQKKAPFQDPLQADAKLFPVRMWEWGFGVGQAFCFRSTAGSAEEKPGPDEGKQGLQMLGDGSCWGCFPSPKCPRSQGREPSSCGFSVTTLPPQTTSLSAGPAGVRVSPDLKKVPSHLIWNHAVLRANILWV